MIKRKIQKEISNWLNSEEKNALLISGVRQAGKTFIIEDTLARENRDYVKFNLIEQEEVLRLLESTTGKGVKTLLATLSILSDKPLIKGETVIFIDEVQEYKEMVTMIKFLVEEGSYRYILSGSLLGVELNDLRSAPVGSLREIEMFPLDFEEYVMAVSGAGDEVLQLLKESFVNASPVNEVLHERMMDLFYQYLIVGGMPKAVQTFIDSNDYYEVMKAHQEIYPLYYRDFTKYEAKNNKLKLIAAYQLIPAELNKKNKRFKYSDLDKNLRFESFEDSFQWLVHAGVALPVYNVQKPVSPLLINRNSNLFKLFLSDIGMLSTMFGREVILKMLRKEKDINYGAIFENAVAQELRAHGYQGYYFNSKKQGELDFLIEKDGTCLPIEVKSGKSYKFHSALTQVLSNDLYHINKAVVLCDFNVEKTDKITYYPVYMMMFL